MPQSKMFILARRSLKTATICCLLGCVLGQAEPNATNNEQLATKQPEANDNNSNNNHDLWSMVAEMREGTKTGVETKPMRNAQFDWNINLDQHGLYQLNWRVNYPKNKIVFALEINTSKSNFSYGSDLFALGFSERGELSSSDYCLIWFDLSHKIHLQDAKTSPDNLLSLVDSSKSVCSLVRGHRSSGNVAESRDEDKDSEDVADLNELDRRELLTGSRGPNKAAASDDNVVEVLFKRPLEVCDESESYYTIDNGTTHMVWFTVKGPLLSLDGVNLTRLREESNRFNRKYEGGVGLNFESGLRRAQLIATKPRHSPSASTSKSTSALDVRMEKFAVPDAETTYWCKLFKLPEKFEARRFHITQYEAVIEPGNEHVVHHMELFNCATTNARQRQKLADLYHSQGGWSGHCTSGSRPAATDSCRRVILAWAMGAKPLVYPEQVGQSIGGAAYSPYVVLEVHYNNVARSKGLVDSSGLRFRYSPELRPFDAGVLEIGLEYTDKNSIPPGMLTPLAGYCVSECTRAAMSADGEPPLFLGANDAEPDPETTGGGRDNDSEQDGSQHNQHRRHRSQQQPARRNRRRAHQGRRLPSSAVGLGRAGGVHIFAAQMHTHLTGVASWTEHVRGGRVLRELQRDDHYSPHFQEIRLLPEPIHVEPGDALIHYCLYDTRSRPNMTLGGHATTDEMCVSYLHYYPKIDLEVCKSSVETRALEEYFANLAREEKQNTSDKLDLRSGGDDTNFDDDDEDDGEGDFGRGSLSQSAANSRSVSSNYHSINWSPRRAKELIEFYSEAPLSVQCNRSDGTRWPGNWNGIEPTRLVKWPRRGTGAARGRIPPRANLDFFGRPGASDLIAYRGTGSARRHAQCLQRRAGPGNSNGDSL